MYIESNVKNCLTSSNVEFEISVKIAQTPVAAGRRGLAVTPTVCTVPELLAAYGF